MRLIICADCGEEKRHHAKGLCKACYRRRHYEAHREEQLAYSRCYYKEHPKKEEKAAYMRDYYQQNREKKKAYARCYYQKNRERGLAVRHFYYQTHKAESQEQGRRWRQEHHKRWLITNRCAQQRRRARKRGLPNTLTKKEAEQKLSIDQCFYCGATADLVLDHFVPLAGAENRACGTTVANSVVACRSCNATKHNKMPSEIFHQLRLDSN